VLDSHGGTAVKVVNGKPDREANQNDIGIINPCFYFMSL